MGETGHVPRETATDVLDALTLSVTYMKLGCRGKGNNYFDELQICSK